MDMTMIEAGKIENGATFHDGSAIDVVSETAKFITVRLSGGAEMLGGSVIRKWKKTSLIKLAA